MAVINPEVGKFNYFEHEIQIYGRILSKTPDHEYPNTWGLKCPVCEKWFTEGDDVRVLIPCTGKLFPPTMVHTECINPLGGLHDTAEFIERIFNDWSLLSGTWKPDLW